MVEGKVLAVFESAPGEEDGQVGRVVNVGVAQVAAEQGHGVFEEIRLSLGPVNEPLEEVVQHAHLAMVDPLELRDLFLRLSVVTEIVVAVERFLFLTDLEDRCRKTIDHQGDDTGRVALEGELRHPQHEVELFEELGLVENVFGQLVFGRGLGQLLPLARDVEAFFQFPHRGEILVNSLAVVAPELALKSAQIIRNDVENAAALIEPLEAALHFAGATLHKHLPEQFRGFVFRRKQHAVACPREAAVGLVDVNAKIERGKARLLTEMLDRELIERDGISKAAPGGVLRRSEKAVFRGMTTDDGGMREAAEDGEVIAKVAQRFQVGRERVAGAAFLWKELPWQHAEVVRDQQHPARRICRLREERTGEAIERRKSERYAEAAQKSSAACARR